MPHKDPEAHRAYHAAYREAKRELIRPKNRLYAATHKPQRRLYDAAHMCPVQPLLLTLAPSKKKTG